MSAVFRELIIEFGGQEYRVTPDLKLLRSIESAGISLAAMANGIATGAPQISHVAYVLFRLLQSAGAKVDEDDVYGELMRAGTDAARGLIMAVMQAFTPGLLDEKKPDAPAKKVVKRGA